MFASSNNVGLMALLLLGTITLHGCGGGGGAGGGGGDVTTTTPSGPPTTTTSSGPHWDVDSPCVEEGSVTDCVKYLNEQYLGFDENDDTSPLGVTIRGQPHYNEQWLFCGGTCFNGHPDCYTPGSILNHKIMLCKNANSCKVENTPAMPMNDAVGIIFQPTAVMTQLTKCAWDFDGSADKRTNGGCSAAPPKTTCDSNVSAYWDICPETGKPIADDYSCPTVTRVDCEVVATTKYPNLCYWRGAAFYSDARPTAHGDYPANLTKGDPSGIRQMLKQRVANQGDGNQTQGGVPKDKGGIPLLQFWDEITMDGKVLKEMLKIAPKAAIAAIMYFKGNKEARSWADKYNNKLKEDWGFKVPIVALDVSQDLRNTTGPFAEPEPATSLESVNV